MTALRGPQPAAASLLGWALRSALATLALLLAATTLSWAAPIRVVASLPNLGAIANEVGGDRVEVSICATGVQDAHFVDPKPSLILKLRSADLLLVNGLDLEVGWIPPLTQGARNARILPGAEGYVDCSTSIGVLEVPAGPVSRAQGDVHLYGNPHYLADPLNAEAVAGQIAAALGRAAPEQAATFKAKAEDFSRRLHAAVFGAELVDLVGGPKLARLARSGELASFLGSSSQSGRPLADRLGGWMGKLRPFQGAKIVTYHRDYTYFAGRFGLEVVDYVEPKPGIPPSAKHLVELTERLQRGDVKVLITRPYVEHRSTDLLAERTRVPVVTLPLEVGGDPEATDYFKLFDLTVARLATALGGASPQGH